MASPIVIEIPPPPPKPLTAQALTDAQWAQTWRYACQHAQASAPLLFTVKRWWRSRMLWAGGAMATLGAAAKAAAVWAFAERDLVVSAFGAYGPAVFLGFGLLVIGLRLVTSGKLTK